jgi:kynurenine formamidase
MNTIDLTHTLTDNFPVFPGDEPFRLVQDHSFAADSFNNHVFSGSVHIGTHIDAPMHMTPDGIRITEIALDRLIGPGYLVDARNREVIEASLADSIPEAAIVLVWTDWSSRIGQSGYFTGHPVLSEEFAQRLVKKHIRLLGMDMPSPDHFPYPVHKRLFAAGIPMVENLTHLSLLEEANSFEVIALPLNLAADGAPARVVARF